MNTEEYFKSFSRVFEGYFDRWSIDYNLDKLETDDKYRNNTSNLIELKLRDLSSTLKFLQIYRIGKLQWILDWSNKHNKFAYVKVYLGPYIDGNDEWYIKDRNQAEVKVLFLDESPDKRRDFK